MSKIEILLTAAPPVGTEARRAWQQALDAAMAKSVRQVIAAAGVARAAAIEAGDHRSAQRAEQIAANALRLADLAEKR